MNETETFFLGSIILYLGVAGGSLFLRFLWQMLAGGQFTVLTRLSYRLAVNILLGGVLVYIVFFSVFSVVRYNLLVPAMYDMGNMEQAIWNTAHGDIVRMTTQYPATSRLHYHTEPIFLLLAPFYSFWPDGRLLLIIQTVVMALGAIPVFFIARHKLSSNLAALALGLAYLLYPALHQANVVDFHPLALGTTFILAGFYFFLRQRTMPSYIFFLLAISSREEYAAMVLLIGLYAAVWCRQRRFGVLLFLSGLAWLLLVVAVIFPSFSPTGSIMQLNLYDYLRQVRFSAGEMLPRLNYLLFLFAPVVFMPVFSLLLFGVGLLGFVTIILRPELSLLAGVMHNHVSLVAPVFLATIFGIIWLSRRLRQPEQKVTLFSLAVCLASLATVIILQFTPLGYWQNLRSPFSPSQRQAIQQIAAAVPSDASVMVPSALGTRFANRRNFYNISAYGQVRADYVIVFDHLQNDCPAWAIGSYSCRDRSAEYRARLATLQADARYRLVRQEAGIYLFEQKRDRVE